MIIYSTKSGLVQAPVPLSYPGFLILKSRLIQRKRFTVEISKHMEIIKNKNVVIHRNRLNKNFFYLAYRSCPGNC